jgi:NADH-quinone oxidoreductase subunit G
VISQGHYENGVKPNETIKKVMGGRDPKLLMNIKDVSEVNQVDLSEIDGPATSESFKQIEKGN